MEKTELLFIRTIPHTGTYFINDLLSSHSKISPAILVDSYLIPHLTRLKTHPNYISNLKKKIIYAALKSNHILLNNPIPYLETYPEESKYKYISIFEHIVPKGHNGKIWLRDFVEEGIEIKQIITLRDPLKIILSIYIQSGSNWRERELALENTEDAFRHILSQKNNKHIYFFPIDSTESYNEKNTELKKMFEFLNLDIEDRLFKKLHNPDQLHETNEHNKGNVTYFDYSFIEKIDKIKKRIKKGQSIEGISDYVDREIIRFRKMTGLQEFFESNNYKNLCWFK